MPGSSPISGWPIPIDSDALGDAAGQVIRDMVDAIEAGWTAYTPVLTATTTNPVLGTGGTIVGKWKRIGKTVLFRIEITFGSAGVNAGNGTYTITLPTNATRTNLPVGLAFLRPAAGFNVNAAVTSAVGSIQLASDAGAVVTHAVPWAWAANYQINIEGAYEAA
jgi:hypothetical protein